MARVHKAILRDIADFGLDPKVPHGAGKTNFSGRMGAGTALLPSEVKAEEEQKAPPPPAPTPTHKPPVFGAKAAAPKPGLVELTDADVDGSERKPAGE